ncbi:hypothetical protein HY995_02125 [Candidatus Micrarchaeota archaeon]|nr:hypothetical protein [Candidatus Micrarchaeota archaeon]MBI5176865.1 hypothetical protein [Candidatus Micrarchaeota archaeon]
MDKPRVVGVKALVLEERAPPANELIVQRHGPEIIVGGETKKEGGFLARIRKMFGI